MNQEKWALLSVYNKAGIVEFAVALVKMGWKILASGGTAKALTSANVPVRDVADLVGGGAILKHRVVTLSRELHAGLLADEKDPEQVLEMEKLGLPIIDMVVCDFYPLSEAIAEDDATINSVVELTDIGGPTMVRSAAKGNRIVVCRYEDRQPVLDELNASGDVCPKNREALRARAEFIVAGYCLDSARFHSKGGFEGVMGERIDILPKGENAPQGPATLYVSNKNDTFGPTGFKTITEQPLSYNNWTDIDRLLQTISHINAAWKNGGLGCPHIVVIVKHGNPCGVGVARNAKEAIVKATKGDSLAAFGGLVMTNFGIDKPIAKLLVTANMPKGQVQKFDSVIAPVFGAGVDEFLARKGGKCRLVVNPDLATDNIELDNSRYFRFMRSGFLTQSNYTFVLDLAKAVNVFGRKLTKREYEDMLLAWAICATSNSNTITIVKKRMLIGNGVGQQARVWAAKLAVMRAKDAGHAKSLKGAVACSDSFFPYPDALLKLINAGISTVFTTSGSKLGDEKVRALCKGRGIKLCMMPDSEARGFYRH